MRILEFFISFNLSSNYLYYYILNHNSTFLSTTNYPHLLHIPKKKFPKHNTSHVTNFLFKRKTISSIYNVYVYRGNKKKALIKNKAGKRSSIHHWNPFSFILGFTAFFSSISTIGKAITRYVGHKSNCQSVSPNLSNRKLPPPSPSSRGKWSATFHCSFYSLFFLFFPSLFFIFSFFSLFYSRSYRVMKNKSLDSGSGLWHFGKLLKPLLYCCTECFRICMKYRQIGKMSEVHKLCFSIFFGWQDLFNCTNSLVLIWYHSILFSIFKSDDIHNENIMKSL